MWDHDGIVDAFEPPYPAVSRFYLIRNEKQLKKVFDRHEWSLDDSETRNHFEELKKKLPFITLNTVHSGGSIICYDDAKSIFESGDASLHLLEELRLALEAWPEPSVFVKGGLVAYRDSDSRNELRFWDWRNIYPHAPGKVVKRPVQ